MITQLEPPIQSFWYLSKGTLLIMGAISSHLLLFFKLMYLPRQLPELSLDWASSPSPESRVSARELSDCADTTNESSNSMLLEQTVTSAREWHIFSRNMRICTSILKATRDLYILHCTSALLAIAYAPSHTFRFDISCSGFLRGQIRLVSFCEHEHSLSKLVFNCYLIPKLGFN